MTKIITEQERHLREHFKFEIHTSILNTVRPPMEDVGLFSDLKPKVMAPTLQVLQ